MPIPLFFAIVPEANEVFVNGSVLENYPVRLFDRAKYFAEQNRPRHITTPQKPTPRLSGRRLKTSSTKAGRSSRPWTTATWRAATGIAPYTSTHSVWAQPSLISTTNPSETSRPPGEPVPKSISIGTTRMPPTTGRRISVLGQALGLVGADDYLQAK